jgi:hypothetical protein
MDLPSEWPINASDPLPDVKRTLMAREAYAEARKAFDQGVSSPWCVAEPGGLRPDDPAALSIGSNHKGEGKEDPPPVSVGYPEH